MVNTPMHLKQTGYKCVLGVLIPPHGGVKSEEVTDNGIPIHISFCDSKNCNWDYR